MKFKILPTLLSFLWLLDILVIQVNAKCSASDVMEAYRKRRDADEGDDMVDEDSTDIEKGSIESQAAAVIGIKALDDMSSMDSIMAISAKCCYSSFKCWKTGGLCLPSWLKPFFTCYDGSLCSGNCGCVKPSSTCSTSCTGNCGSEGTCKSECAYNEYDSPYYSCGNNCKCCARCQGTCTKNGVSGVCKKSCNSQEMDGGSCSVLSLCRCCQPKPPSCEGPCGTNGECKKSCDSQETDSGACSGSPGCRCCEKTVGCNNTPCGNRGRCTTSDQCKWPREIVPGYCPGSNCQCCGLLRPIGDDHVPY